MIEIRKGADRGYADHGWLKSFHTFSFADYYDPANMGYGALRVINEDRVSPGRGFGTHGHKDMEIISYVLEGELEHKDNMGTGSVIRPGDVQRMSAGRGVLHSEYNPSKSNGVHFLQIWIQPDVVGIAPSYEQKRFEAAEKRGKLRLIASPDAREGSVTIHQDATLLAGLFDAGEKEEYALSAGRRAWVHAARGEVTINGIRLTAGDALKVADVDSLAIEQGNKSEILLFDLA